MVGRGNAILPTDADILLRNGLYQKTYDQRFSNTSTNSVSSGNRTDDDTDSSGDHDSSTCDDSGRFSAGEDFILCPPSPFVSKKDVKKGALSNIIRNKLDKTEPEVTLSKKEPLHSTKIYVEASKKILKPKILHENVVSCQQEISEPRTYPPVNAPTCYVCSQKDEGFFNADCRRCWSLLYNIDVTPSHVFAVLRIWHPQVQKAIIRLVNRALELGCRPNDRDLVTDMTLLHFSVKAGSPSIGNASQALQAFRNLIDEGADPLLRCKWTHMTSLHYAAFFNVAPVIDLLLSISQEINPNDLCPEYDNATPLHIAAANLCQNAVETLLSYGANKRIKDSHSRIPLECLPHEDQYNMLPDMKVIISRLRLLLSHDHFDIPPRHAASDTGMGSGKALLKAMNMNIGDRVFISGIKTGILRYVGPTEFATGLWAGVELETPQGRHNGSLNGVVYFRCAKNFGIFVPVNRITKIMKTPEKNASLNRSRCRKNSQNKTERRCSRRDSRSLSLPPGKVNHGRVDISRISSKVAQDICNSERHLSIGDRVCVDMHGLKTGNESATGTVQYTGSVNFASGYWIGVELDEPNGSHDGSLCGTRYFDCPAHHGIFAVPSRITKTKHSALRNRSSSLSRRLPQYNGPMTVSLHSIDTSNAQSTVPPALPASNCRKHSTSFYPVNTSMSSLNKCFSARYVKSREKQRELIEKDEEKKKKPKWVEPDPIEDPARERKEKKSSPHWLEVGHTVFYKNKIGTVRYIGTVHFSPGTWLGLELGDSSGLNDGKVKGKRYFSCKAKHGVLVKPSKVTVHGINGALLVKNPDEIS